MGVRRAPGAAAAIRPTRCRPGRRALANLSLTMLCLDAAERGDPVWPGRAYQRFKDASNMTDRQGALAALLYSGSSLADAALERFYAMFAGRRAGRRQVVRDAGDGARARRPGVRARQAAAAPPGLQHRQSEPRAQPDRRVLPRQPGGVPPQPTAPATRSGPTACSRSTPSTRSSPRSIARALDRWTQLAEPYRQAARGSRSRASPRRPKLSSDTGEIVSRALVGRLRRAMAAAKSRKNAFYAQSGGVTAVINASACGVIETARAHRDVIGNVYAGRNGIIGALTEDLIDTGKESAAAIRGAALDAGGRVRLVPLQAEVARQEPARVRAADRGLPRPRHRLVLLQRRRRLGRHLLQGQPALGSRWAIRCRRSTCRRRSTTTCRSPTAARASARSPSTSRCRRSKRRSTCARWRAPRPRCSCSR